MFSRLGAHRRARRISRVDERLSCGFSTQADASLALRNAGRLTEEAAPRGSDAFLSKTWSAAVSRCDYAAGRKCNFNSVRFCTKGGEAFRIRETPAQSEFAGDGRRRSESDDGSDHRKLVAPVGGG
ncbi:MAG: hypothetical protein C3F11_18570 [Methylocystaceae bacterium]|nr:MAG: hypothetical protein C3F11_18570 [Methylocystaceae bacterium]